MDGGRAVGGVVFVAAHYVTVRWNTLHGNAADSDGLNGVLITPSGATIVSTTTTLPTQSSITS